ncbi:hypothetical protein MNB_ARC-1_1310 [hydrothermal vent metagenome]|uniref:Endonuclease GajA/Old nuclease/RecF-like AAA domain-containing protein n=1 Tax=hydrothermal vent metagenome TaxID=652676 RepID=A0A3B1DY92_9ZZZZ
MNRHFIKNIEIKNFKCFKDFKAEGFGRVNLIGGKNNVGKTAFMEVCLLSQSDSISDLYKKILEIKTHRNIVNNLLEKNDRQQELQKLINKNIDFSINRIESISQDLGDGHYMDIDIGCTHISKDEENGNILIFLRYDEIDMPREYTYSRLINILDLALESTKKQFSLNFISPYSNSNEELEDIIGQSKLDDKYDELNKYLSDVFNVKSIDIIKNKPMLQVNNEYKELSYFGQGIKTFINIISSILLLKDDVIFIDEIENGIHYTNLDKLWEIILTISKQQNVQVFATTHSKECIESYARVAKRLEDEEIGFIELGRNKKNELDSVVMDSEMFQRFIKLGNEVRGW